MGEGPRDAVCLNAWHGGGACFATGVMPGVGWLAAPDAAAAHGPDPAALWVPLALERGERSSTRLARRTSALAALASRR